MGKENLMISSLAADLQADRLKTAGREITAALLSWDHRRCEQSQQTDRQICGGLAGRAAPRPIPQGASESPGDPGTGLWGAARRAAPRRFPPFPAHGK